LRVLPAASVARKLYIRQGMGVGLFRIQYGGRNKRRGCKPESHSKASGEARTLD
jgi:small subunit ribosomal protein S19e